MLPKRSLTLTEVEYRSRHLSRKATRPAKPYSMSTVSAVDAGSWMSNSLQSPCQGIASVDVSCSIYEVSCCRAEIILNVSHALSSRSD